jgi:hypothetical protein
MRANSESWIVLLVGACAAAGKLPPPGWTKSSESGRALSLSDITGQGRRSMFFWFDWKLKIHLPTTLITDLGTTHSIGLPIHVYPLYENAFRAHRNQTLQENDKESARLYANFAKVAEQNPLAWNYGQPAATEETIQTVSKKNRMICYPCKLHQERTIAWRTNSHADPLLMNAFNNVNLAGTCLLTSTEYARELGIPENRWIYPLGGAGTDDSEYCMHLPTLPRPLSGLSYSRLTKLNWSLGTSKLLLEPRTLEIVRCRVRDIWPNKRWHWYLRLLLVSAPFPNFLNPYWHISHYSCFPIIPKLACHHLGLSITNPPKPITLLGGLTSFGGAGNNYSMHVSSSRGPSFLMTIQQIKKIDPDLTPPGYHRDGSQAPKRTGSSRVDISKRRRRDTPACYLSLLQAPQPPLSIPCEKPSSQSHDRLASASQRSASSRRG